MDSVSSWSIKLRSVHFHSRFSAWAVYHRPILLHLLSREYSFVILSSNRDLWLQHTEAFFPFGNRWNFHAIILLSENSVNLNSISDYLFDENVPFGVEKKVSDCLQIFHKREYSTLIQLYRASVSYNIVRGFLVLSFWPQRNVWPSAHFYYWNHNVNGIFFHE